LEKSKNIEIINPYGFIYITINLINGKIYIGKRKFNRGWQYYLGGGVAFKKSVKKYGRENFIRNIIAIAYSKEELNNLEIEFIKNHNAVNSLDYYNITKGGDTGLEGFHHSDETRQKMSMSQKGENHPMFGKHHTLEARKKISETSKLKKHSEETKRKISESQKGEKGNNYGKHPSEETRRKMSESRRNLPKEIKKKFGDPNRKVTPEQAKEIVAKYTTGKYTHKKLAEEYPVKKSTIGRIINNLELYL